MNFFNKFLNQAYTDKPKPTVAEQLKRAENELEHFTRPYHDMAFIQRQVLYWAERVLVLRALVASEVAPVVDAALAVADDVCDQCGQSQGTHHPCCGKSMRPRLLP